MSPQYALSTWFDKAGQPISDLAQLDRLLSDPSYRTVAQTTIKNLSEPSKTINVSTVWLGFNFAFGGGPPLIFETMLFYSDGDLELAQRHATEKGAREYHDAAVAQIAATMDGAHVS